MSQTDTSARSEPESDVEAARAAAGSGREYVSKAAPYLRDGIESGAVTAVIGATSLLGGFRALLGGERKRGLTRLALGAALLAAALAQWRSRNRGQEPEAEATDEAASGSDVEAVTDEASGAGEQDYVGEAAAEVPAAEVPDASSDVTTEGTLTDEEGTDAAEVRAEEIDRLGEAAFDRQSREVPVPQRAFNQGFLAHSSEAFWGIRTSDDAVLVSQNYDAVQNRGEVRYVASSEIGDDVRELPIPTAVLNHWDEVGGGGTAVVGGDDILFVTTDALAADGLLRVLPAEWADDLSE